MSEPIPHPRDVFDYAGGEAVERAFLDSLARGRLHHAWLLVGPSGVGKATFAYRAARRLLGGAEAPAFGLLGSDPADPVSRLVAARSHPDLLVLQRDPEDGKTRRGIPVEEARGLPEFFAKSPSKAAFRVAIIDEADDLNASSANAVLKTLEEPPERGVLFLVSHAPGALLPTLRSRCRRLRFEPPEAAAVQGWVAARAGVTEADAARLLDMARGAPGGAWRLAAEDALAADRAAREIFARLPGVDETALLAVTDGFRGPAGAARFALLFDRLAAQVHESARGRLADGEGRGLDAWSEAFDMLIDLPRQAEALNLDRADTLHTALARLRAIG